MNPVISHGNGVPFLFQEQLESVAKAGGRVTGNCGSPGKCTWKIEFEADFVIHFDPYLMLDRQVAHVFPMLAVAAADFLQWWFAHSWCIAFLVCKVMIQKWGISMFGEWDFLKQMGFPMGFPLKIGVQSKWISNCWLENIGDHEFPMMVNYG